MGKSKGQVVGDTVTEISNTKQVYKDCTEKYRMLQTLKQILPSNMKMILER